MRPFFLFVIVLTSASVRAQQSSDPEEILKEADRLAWLRSWTRAEPLFAEAERMFAVRGDRRNEIYAQAGRIRGQLHRLAVPEVSRQLEGLLEDPIVQNDERLRLRALVVKGETDEDLDPDLAEQSWRDVLTVSQKLGDAGWENRAKGELALIAGVQGNMSAAAVGLMQAIQVAQKQADTSSIVRWLTILGHGMAQFGRYEEAIAQYDRALKAAAPIEETSFPVMTYLGKGSALVKLGRREQADDILRKALAVAEQKESFGYQAEIRIKLALLAAQRGNRAEAIRELESALELGTRAGGHRIVAEASLELAKLQQQNNQTPQAAATLDRGVKEARAVSEQILLPKLLAARAEISVRQNQFARGIEFADEATDILDGLLAGVRSPWLQGRLIGAMNEVYAASIRVHGRSKASPERFFSAIERARGRTLANLLLSQPLVRLAKTPQQKSQERALALLQLELLRTSSRPRRKALLDEIFAKEMEMTPTPTSLTGQTVRKPIVLAALRSQLRPDEVFLEFVSTPEEAYCLIATKSTARVRHLSLPQDHQLALVQAIQANSDISALAATLGKQLIELPELKTAKRIVIAPDGPLHHVPFEILRVNGKSLLETHVVSYTPSGSVLSLLRGRKSPIAASLLAIAPTRVADSKEEMSMVFGKTARGVYDVDPGRLPPLQSAADEVQAIARTINSGRSRVLLGAEGSEAALKALPLRQFSILHFAVHGVMSSKYPERSALLLEPGSQTEDGLLQAREILELPISADLVTLSACETAAGAAFGQEGVSSLVRPFLAAGAKSVVANLWAADDAFSSSLMKEFYRHLAAEMDKGEALRQAKLKMIATFGKDAVPKLWSGVLIFGDANAGVFVKEKR